MGNTELHKKLGERIVHLREESGIRQVDLANRLDMDGGYLRRIEKGKINMTLNAVERIADALDVEMKDLFDFKKE